MSLKKSVVLASGSPRRQHLLLELVEDFEIYVPNIDEDALTSPDPVATAEALASAKAMAVLNVRPDCLVIGGDTVVALPNGDGSFQQFAKPGSPKDAEKILKLLSGKTHLVITGVCLAWDEGSRVISETSEVTFRELTAAEIKAYVKTGEPMDKAGAYACQGGAKSFIEKMEGSQYNVIGLPLERLKEALAEFEE
jgi:septum formation protein